MRARQNLPLILDMDGVWVSSDVSLELLLQYLKSEPLRGPWRALRWALKGKSVLKHNLQQAVGHQFDVEHLPVNGALRASAIYRNAVEKALVSGSHAEIVERVAAKNPDFQWSEGSREDRNLIGAEKAALLKERFPDGFAYVGDSSEDIEVWQAAERAYAVQPSKEALKRARQRRINVEVIEELPAQLPAIIESMRLHQWAKNALIFMMLGLNLAYIHPEWLFGLAATFVAFGLVASATYILNDLLDIQSDRLHPDKRHRPLASGRLKLVNAIGAVLAIGSVGLLLAVAVSLQVGAMVAAYAILSLCYSLKLKRVAVLDAAMLSLLFCWRIMTGAVVISVELVPWFTAALALFFFSLALGKRGIELRPKFLALNDYGAHAVSGRGYQAADYPVVLALGVAAGLGSAIVTMIYALLSDGSIISHPGIAFGVCSLLTYWLGYVWITINRGEMHHDPVLFALRDKQSLAVLGGMALLILAGQIVVPGHGL